MAGLRTNIEINVHERGPTAEKYAVYDAPPMCFSEGERHFKEFTNGRRLKDCEISAGIFYARQRAGRPSGFCYSNGSFEGIDIKLPEKFVVYYSSSNSEVDAYPSNQTFFDGRRQLDLISELGLLADSIGSHLVVRLHPNSSQADYEEIARGVEPYPVTLISPSSRIDSYQLGMRASHRFSIGSTISWELMYDGYDVAILANSIAINQPGCNTLRTAEEVFQYLKKSPICGAREFCIRIADYSLNFGVQYHIYSSSGLHSGSLNWDLLDALRDAFGEVRKHVRGRGSVVSP